MTRALLIGGTGFLGHHTVDAFRTAGYEVGVLSRGERDTELAESATMLHGDRSVRADIEAARDEFDPDVVVDLVGMHPGDVEIALEVFGGVESYVYVSSASVYAPPLRLPSRETDPLHECTPEQATDDTMATYGNRKAECDRLVRSAAAADEIGGLVVRPVVVYGPGDWSGRHDYWFDRVARHDRVVVPGDGASTFHRVFAPDVADAIRLVAEDGAPGTAYNVAERDTAWLDRTVELAADALDTTVEIVHASARELATVDLAPTDFPLYSPVPRLCAADRLSALGWESTPLPEAFSRTIDACHSTTGPKSTIATHDYAIPRDTEETLIERLST